MQQAFRGAEQLITRRRRCLPRCRRDRRAAFQRQPACIRWSQPVLKLYTDPSLHRPDCRLTENLELPGFQTLGRCLPTPWPSSLERGTARRPAPPLTHEHTHTCHSICQSVLVTQIHRWAGIAFYVPILSHCHFPCCIMDPRYYRPTYNLHGRRPSSQRRQSYCRFCTRFCHWADRINK